MRFVYLFTKNLEIDFTFLKTGNLSIKTKIEFLIIKYLNFVLDCFFRKNEIKKAKLLGDYYYYQSKCDITALETMFEDSYFKDLLPKNSIIIDIGANIGQATFFYNNFLDAHIVISIEPIKESFNILKMNSKNALNYAVSSEKELKLYKNSLLTASIYSKNTSETETVRGILLDDIQDIKKLEVINLIKIDAEGSELNIVKENKAIIKKADYLYIEINLQVNNGNNLKGILDVLFEDFYIYKIAYVHANSEAIDIVFKNKR